MSAHTPELIHCKKCRKDYENHSDLLAFCPTCYSYPLGEKERLRKQLHIALDALQMRLGSRVSLGAIRTKTRLAIKEIEEI